MFNRANQFHWFFQLHCQLLVGKILFTTINWVWVFLRHPLPLRISEGFSKTRPNTSHFGNFTVVGKGQPFGQLISTYVQRMQQEWNLVLVIFQSPCLKSVDTEISWFIACSMKIAMNWGIHRIPQMLDKPILYCCLDIFQYVHILLGINPHFKCCKSKKRINRQTCDLVGCYIPLISIDHIPYLNYMCFLPPPPVNHKPNAKSTGRPLASLAPCRRTFCTCLSKRW